MFETQRMQLEINNYLSKILPSDVVLDVISKHLNQMKWNKVLSEISSIHWVVTSNNLNSFRKIEGREKVQYYSTDYGELLLDDITHVSNDISCDLYDCLTVYTTSVVWNISKNKDSMIVVHRW